MIRSLLSSSLLLVTALASASADSERADAYALSPLPAGTSWDDYTPDFNHDGSRILFSSNRAGGSSQLFVLDVSSGAVEQLTEGPELNHYGSYSPDGRWIAWISARSGNPELWVMASDGTGGRQLTAGDHGFHERPDWSPDGRHLAFDWGRDGQRDIWTIEIDGGTLHRVTADRAEDSYASWSPDGQRLVFRSRGRGPSVDLYTVRLDGSDLSRLTHLPEIAWAPHWSDDGSRIVFWAGEGWDFQIYTIAPDGSSLTRLTDAWEWNWSPRWSRDGEWITFGSSRSGRRGVYVMRADGTEVRQLTNQEPSHFARSVLEEGVDRALSRLAYSTQGAPDAVFTSGTECRVLLRQLLARGELDAARRLADWNLERNPRSADAADVWNQVRRAQGEPTPPTARELVNLYRHGAYEEAWRLYTQARERFPAWRPYSAGWLRVLVNELEILGEHRELARLSAEAAVIYPDESLFHAARALALEGLGRRAEALAAARRALELDPENRAARRLLGDR